MTNVHTMKDLSSGHRLGSAREIELEGALRISSKSVTDLVNEYRNLQDVCLEREKEFHRLHADIGNKVSQLNGANTKLTSQITSERKSHSESQREHEAERTKYSAEIK